MDLDPAIFVIDLQDANKKQIFNFIFSSYYFLKIHSHLFSQIKSQKESQNSRNQGFSYYFCMMIEGSRRPKNMWIRIRIRNTGTVARHSVPGQVVKAGIDKCVACLGGVEPTGQVWRRGRPGGPGGTAHPCLSGL